MNGHNFFVKKTCINTPHPPEDMKPPFFFCLNFHRYLRRDFFLAEVTSSEEEGSGWLCATTKGREWVWDLGYAGLSYYVEVMLNQKVWVK